MLKSDYICLELGTYSYTRQVFLGLARDLLLFRFFNKVCFWSNLYQAVVAVAAAAAWKTASFVGEGSATRRAPFVDCGSVVGLINYCIRTKRGSVTPSKSEQKVALADIWWPLVISNQVKLSFEKNPSSLEIIMKLSPFA